MVKSIFIHEKFFSNQWIKVCYSCFSFVYLPKIKRKTVYNEFSGFDEYIPMSIIAFHFFFVTEVWNLWTFCTLDNLLWKWNKLEFKYLYVSPCMYSIHVIKCNTCVKPFRDSSIYTHNATYCNVYPKKGPCWSSSLMQCLGYNLRQILAWKFLMSFCLSKISSFLQRPKPDHYNISETILAEG